MNDTLNLESKIAKSLRTLRNEKGYNQEYVAYNINVSPKTYSNIENSKSSITINILMKLAKFYGINIFDFLTDEISSMSLDMCSELSLRHTAGNFNISQELLTQLKERIQDLRTELLNKERHINHLQQLLLNVKNL